MLPFVELGGVRVGTHDLFSIAGILVGLAIYYSELRRRGMLDERILFISLAVLIGGGIGGRLLLAWEHLPAYEDLGTAPLTWVIEHSGKSLLGAIVGGWIAAVIAKWAFRYTRSTGDCYALAIPVAVAIGRVGCLLSELPLGTPTTLPWGVSVPASAAAAFAALPWLRPADAPEHGLRDPVQPRGDRRDLAVRAPHPVQGDLLKAYLLAAFVFRFLVEFVRGNQPQAFGLTGPQLVLIPLTALLVVHFVREARSGLGASHLHHRRYRRASREGRGDGLAATRSGPVEAAMGWLREQDPRLTLDALGKQLREAGYGQQEVNAAVAARQAELDAALPPGPDLRGRAAAILVVTFLAAWGIISLALVTGESTTSRRGGLRGADPRRGAAPDAPGGAGHRQGERTPQARRRRRDGHGAHRAVHLPGRRRRPVRRHDPAVQLREGA